MDVVDSYPFGAREDDDVEEEEFARSGAQAAVGLSPRGDRQRGTRRRRGRRERGGSQTRARRLPEAAGGEPQGVGGADASAEGAR